MEREKMICMKVYTLLNLLNLLVSLMGPTLFLSQKQASTHDHTTIFIPNYIPLHGCSSDDITKHFFPIIGLHLEGSCRQTQDWYCLRKRHCEASARTSLLPSVPFLSSGKRKANPDTQTLLLCRAFIWQIIKCKQKFSRFLKYVLLLLLLFFHLHHVSVERVV